jgi:hypothetical protein
MDSSFLNYEFLRNLEIFFTKCCKTDLKLHFPNSGKKLAADLSKCKPVVATYAVPNKLPMQTR